MNELMERTAKALGQNGFTVEVFSTGREAAERVCACIAPEESVGTGGSMTIKELGLCQVLQAKGCTMYSHWLTPDDPKVQHKALLADAYLASSNAVTVHGQLVNVDGTGNRVAAMTFGPKRVYLIVGSNKLVDGGVPAAIARIKREACPRNARRLGKNTPCATGGCDAVRCEKGMCNVTSVLDHPTSGHEIMVLLTEEPLGY